MAFDYTNAATNAVAGEYMPFYDPYAANYENPQTGALAGSAPDPNVQYTPPATPLQGGHSNVNPRTGNVDESAQFQNPGAGPGSQFFPSPGQGNGQGQQGAPGQQTAPGQTMQPPQQPNVDIAALQAAVAKMQGYVNTLSHVAHPTAAQQHDLQVDQATLARDQQALQAGQAQMTQYQQQLAAYQQGQSAQGSLGQTVSGQAQVNAGAVNIQAIIQAIMAYLANPNDPSARANLHALASQGAAGQGQAPGQGNSATHQVVNGVGWTLQNGQWVRDDVLGNPTATTPGAQYNPALNPGGSAGYPQGQQFDPQTGQPILQTPGPGGLGLANSQALSTYYQNAYNAAIAYQAQNPGATSFNYNGTVWSLDPTSLMNMRQTAIDEIVNANTTARVNGITTQMPVPFQPAAGTTTPSSLASQPYGTPSGIVNPSAPAPSGGNLSSLQSAVQTMQQYVNNLLAVPASQRSAAQNAALATDEATLAKDQAALTGATAAPTVPTATKTTTTPTLQTAPGVMVGVAGTGYVPPQTGVPSNPAPTPALTTTPTTLPRVTTPSTTSTPSPSYSSPSSSTPTVSVAPTPAPAPTTNYAAAAQTMQNYVNTYLAIPASQRTAAQNAALATDQATLAKDQSLASAPAPAPSYSAPTVTQAPAPAPAPTYNSSSSWFHL